MKVERIIAINFGALHNGDYELGQANLVVGKNGAGKSTFQDLIQIVLAGNDHNLIRLNPAQDTESRKHRRRVTKRTLAAYAVNMTDDGPGRSDGAITVIGLVFQPDPDEKAEPMTALWFADVVPDQVTGDRKATYRIRDEHGALVRHAMKAADFLVREGTNRWRVPNLEELDDTLLARFPRGVAVCSLPKRTYVTRLHEWLSAGALATKQEAERATRAFIQSISLKDISDVDSIVRDRVLDDMDLSTDIQETAATLRELDLLQKESERLQRLEAELNTADRYGQDIARAAREGHIHHVADALQRNERLKEHCRQSVIELGDIDREQIAVQQRIDQVRQELDVTTSRHQYEASQADNQATLQDQRELMQQIETALSARTQAALELRVSLKHAGSLGGLQRLVSALDQDRLPTTRESASQAGFQVHALQGSRDRLVSMVQQLHADTPSAAIFEALEPLVREHDVHLSLLAGAGPASLSVLKDAAFQAYRELTVELNHSRNQQEQIKGLLDDNESGKASEPPSIREALTYLTRELSAANPRLLCDLVRPKDHTIWQGAIEGMLGGARFTILVDSEYEDLAHTLLRDWTHRRQRSDRRPEASGPEPTLVQSRRAREDTRRHPPGPRSIVHELEFDDELARVFVAARYGSTVKVTDAAELASTTSGLMSDGRLSKSYGRRVAKLPAASWVFGLEARRAQRQALTQELADAHARVGILEADARTLESIAKVSIDWSALQLRSVFGNLRRYEGELGELHRRQAESLQSDPEAIALVQRLEQLQIEGQALRAQSKELDDELRNLGHRRESAVSLLAKSQSQQAECEQDLLRRGGAMEAVRLAISPHEDWMQEAERSQPVVSDALVIAAGTIAQRFQALQGHLDRYLEQARDGEGIERVSNVDSSDVWTHLADIVRTLHAVTHRLGELRNSTLRENAEQISDTKHRFASVLTDTLVQKMLSKTKEIQFVIDTLNRPLKNLDFGTHRHYEITRTLKPEFAEYLKFFIVVRDKAQELSPADQWFGSDVFTPEEQAIRDRIKRNLLNASSEEGRRELERIGNAANYYEYDLTFQTEAGTKVLYSEWGTGSGGENATPPYILCGMLVANACGWFRGRGPRLRLLMLDEAFKVHDLERSNRVIEYLQRMGFQLIVAAQMEKATSILPNFTTTLSVARLAARIGNRRTWISQIHTIGLNRDPLRALWEARRREAAAQAELQFRQDFPPPTEGIEPV